MARQLAKLGVDIIGAGILAAFKDDFEAVKTIAKEVRNTVDETGYVQLYVGCLGVMRMISDLHGKPSRLEQQL
ncbi:hypothetical protein SLA2020_093200 [Shorea laevis]